MIKRTTVGDLATKKIQYLVPFVKEVVLDVDLQSKSITLDWQLDWQ